MTSHNHVSRFTFHILALALLLAGSLPVAPRPVAAQVETGGRLFPETGQTVAADFLAVWEAGGGLAVFGLPLTPERPEIDPAEGRLYPVQWFERARFERHPEAAGTSAAVQLGLLGRTLAAQARLTPAANTAPGGSRFFPETGRTVAEPFLSFWAARGGVSIFGLPVTAAAREISADDGQERTVQYFERARLEDHGPTAEPRVRLGLIGREALARPVRLWWEAEEALAHSFTTAFVYAGGVLSADQTLYVHSQGMAFDGGPYRARYAARVPRPGQYWLWARLLMLDAGSPLRWRVDDGPWSVADAATPAMLPLAIAHGQRYAWYRLGGLTLTAGGHPLEIEVLPTLGGGVVAGLDAFALTTEGEGPPAGARETWLPGQALPDEVSLRAALGAAGAPWPRLHRGLAQGGEQRDPAYLARVAPRLRALGADYIRLDHIFDFYDVLQRGPDGRIAFDFRRLDAALDAVLAAGAQPFLSLGLTPALLSPTGVENTPPADLRLWRELVSATVHHVNGTRGLGVRYWEVWNEPNLAPFWSGTFDDYLRLYAATAAAVTTADPSARVGGPATASHEFWVPALIEWAAATGARLDFVSWHLYHVSPLMAANQVALVRGYLARYPRLAGAELVLSEWNLHSDFGARAGFVGDSHVMGAYVAAMTHRLTDAGLGRALFFEAVDGRPPDGQVTWGRWGALTHDGQPKPVYHTLTALARLHDSRQPAVSSDPRVGLLVTRRGEGLALVVWSLAPAGSRPVQARLALERPPAGLTALRRWMVDATHSRLGGDLEEVAPVAGTRTTDGTWTAALTLAPHSVTLLTWEP